MSVTSDETTAVTEPIPAVTSASPTMTTDKEKSDNTTGMFQGNADKKPAWNRLSHGDSETLPVMGASSWPSLSETVKAAPFLNKSSSDSLRDLACGGASSSVPFFPKGSSFLAEQAVGFAISKDTNDADAAAAQLSTQSSTGCNQQHVNQNWNFQRNFNRGGGFSQPLRGCAPGFIRPSPPPLGPPFGPFYPHHMPDQQPFYPMLFTEPPMMYYSHPMRFIEPTPFLPPSREIPLKIKILNQVQYYLSEDNLSRDDYLCRRMNDEGFVHIEFIAGFNKLKALTSDIHLILDSLQGSDFVEVKGYEIRNRRVGRKFVRSQGLRSPFYPSPEYANC